MTKKVELQTQETGLSSGTPFLPDGFVVPDKTRQFMKLSPGDNLIRILSAPIMGYEFFTNDKKPFRRRYDPSNPTFGDFTTDELERFQAKKMEDGKFEGSRYFWMLLVWEYRSNSPKILTITQKGVIKDINSYYHDKDWGDPRKYDININRVGTGKNNTEYTVQVKPKSKANDDILAFVLIVQDDPGIVDLNRVWKGEYPFEAYNW